MHGFSLPSNWNYFRKRNELAIGPQSYKTALKSVAVWRVSKSVLASVSSLDLSDLSLFVGGGFLHFFFKPPVPNYQFHSATLLMCLAFHFKG